MKAAPFLFSVTLCPGAFDIWGVGVVVLADGPAVLLLVALAGFVLLTTAAHEAFGRADRSEFVFFDGEGSTRLTDDRCDRRPVAGGTEPTESVPS